VGNERGLIYKYSSKDSDLRSISYSRYLKKSFAQIHKDLYGDAMLGLIRMGTNIADGNQETSVTEFCYNSMNSFFEELINIKVILFLIHELLR